MWTMENTEGFTQAELNELNEALEMLMRDSFAEAENLNDMLNNAYYPGMTAADLYDAVCDIAGID